MQACSLRWFALLAVLLMVSGCSSPLRSTYRTGRFVVKGTTKVVTTTAKVSTKVVKASAQVATEATKTSVKATTLAVKTTSGVVKTLVNAPQVSFKDTATGLVKSIPWKEGLRLYAASKQAELNAYMKTFKIARSSGIVSATWGQLTSGSIDPFLRPGDLVEIGKLMN